MIGERMKHVFTDYKVWILSYKDECFDKIGLRPSERIKLMNGSLECEYRCYEIFEGKNKDYKKALNEGGEKRVALPTGKPAVSSSRNETPAQPNFKTDRMDRPERRFAAAHAEDEGERAMYMPGKRYFGNERNDGRPGRKEFSKHTAKKHFKDEDDFGGKKKFGDKKSGGNRSSKKPFKKKGRDDFKD
jgi:putative N6-adenine-specific DNA methylase